MYNRIKKKVYMFVMLVMMFSCVSGIKAYAATPKQADDPDYSWETKINNKMHHMNNLPVTDWVTTMTSGGGEETKNFITQGRNPDGSYVKFFSNNGNGKGTPVTWNWSDIQKISKQNRNPVKWNTKTVDGKKYQYTTYGRADNVNHLSFYSYEGSFNIDPTYDMDDMQFTILPVSESLYLYLDVDMFAFVYPACLEQEINDKNFMDYFVFWSGTQTLWGDSKKFHGEKGIELNPTTPPDKFNTFTNWWAKMETANASKAVKNGWKQVKNRADYDGEWKLRIIYGANGTGGSYRFLVGAEFEQPQITYYPGVGATGNIIKKDKEYEVAYTIENNGRKVAWFSRKNYNFTGWNTKEDGSGTPYKPGSKYTKERPLDLYAQWEPIEYGIQFNGNGATAGTMKAMSCSYDQAYTLTANAYKRPGYAFTGWNTKKDGSGTHYMDKASVKNLVKQDGGSITLYAQWKADNYSIHFDGNGASGGGMSDMKCSMNTTYTLTANGYVRTGYSFAGWNLKPGGNGARYADKASVKNLTTEGGKTVILYAQWKANEYTIRFDGNGADGGTMEDLSCLYNTAYSLPANAYQKTGHTFTGWNLEPGGAGARYADQAAVQNLTAEDNGVITLYAQWEANQYTVRFDGNGATNGTMEGKELTLAYDEPRELPLNQFIRTMEDGESLYLGWNTDSGAMDALYGDGSEIVNLTDEPGGVVTLYAVWDDCPGIIAKDLYYTLDQAQSGFITAEELLGQASSMDREDGEIPAGINETNSFVLRDYAPTDFTQFKREGAVSETYLATDSSGNQTLKQIMVYVVDTTAKPVKPEGTTRFINEKYYYLPFEYGGLEDNSIWKTDSEYVKTIKEAFENAKNDTPEEVYHFTHEDILEMKEFVRENGIGNTKSEDALSRFYEQFCEPNRVK